ncbi:MAG: extracellular solute-binding protein [Clostridiales bacterium]|nr:extracellular solute-binding protein [Clostridiales bacterium]
MMKKIILKLGSAILAATLLASGFSVSALNSNISDKSFYEFRQEHAGDSAPNAEITVNGAAYSAATDKNLSVGTVQNESNVLLTSDQGSVTWAFSVADAGLYNIEISYCPLEGKNNPIERNIYINDEIQYSDLSAVSFHRVYQNESADIKLDKQGNQLRPNQVESPRFETITLYSSSYNVGKALTVALKAGVNTITLEAVSEPMAIKSIKFLQKKKLQSYKEVSDGYTLSKVDADTIHIEGEDAAFKSDKTLYAVCDSQSALNSPVSLDTTVMNMIGGSNWSSPLQYIEWIFHVDKAGLYKINIRGKQDYTEGQVSSRRLYIDGKIPFAEANDIEFPYQIGFQNFTLGNGDGEYWFELEAGAHTLRLENGVGQIGELLEKMNLYVADLNDIYKQVFMITGSYPDADRDYNIEKMLPDLLQQIKTANEHLDKIKAEYLALTDIKGDGYANIEKVQIQLKSFIEDVETLPARLDTFRINISNLSSWVLGAVSQPLLIDYIDITSNGDYAAVADKGFFGRLWFGIKTFVVSFFVDYNAISVSEDTKEDITLWLGTGRDQMQAMKQIISQDFTPNYNIGVNIRLVDISVLLPAVAAGYGPDIAISLERSLPMNYAYRGAVQELSSFPNFEEVAARFDPAALTEFRYQNKCYALPDKYTFYMMFYRKDILSELNEAVPTTWKQMYSLLPKLQNQHMTIGLPNISENIIDIFTTLLYQNGGTVYDEKLTKSVLDEEPSLEAFKQFTDFYTKYKVYQKIDALTYFRTGQTPIVIMPYTFFANLQAAAPEIRGQWGFAEVPGTVQEDGSINNVVSGTSTGCCIFSNSKHKDAAWTFLKWWTDTPAQVAFGNEIESIQGPAGRYASANLEAVSQLAWSNSDLSTILSQAKKTQAMPEAPGGYMTGRYIISSAMTVINNGLIPRETIMDYNKMINDEVQSMRKKFGLNQ